MITFSRGDIAPRGDVQAGTQRARSAVGIIDDDISFREALTDLVRSFGFGVVAFASAQAFLQADVARRLVCLIADVHMPGLDGLALQVRLAETGRAIPMIFVTAYPDAKTRARAIAGGAEGFLGKPFDPEELLGLLMSVVGTRRQGVA